MASDAVDELGVDLALVPATGPAGRVTADDVKRFAEGGPAGTQEAPPAQAQPEAAEKLRAGVVP